MLRSVSDALVSLTNAFEKVESLQLRAQMEAMRQCEENKQKQSNVRWLAMSLLLFPLLSLLSDENDNSVITHDIPLSGAEYDMGDLGNNNDLEDEDCR